MIQFLVALALCYVLIKIPFWIFGSLRSGGRRSLVGSLVRGFIAYKTLGLLRGMGGEGKLPRSHGSQTTTAPSDPYATARATPTGQYMLPLNVKKVRKPAGQRPVPPSPSRFRPTQQGKQLKLPLDGEWPENKPRLGRDGQYELPLNVQRQPMSNPAPAPPVQRPSLTGNCARQLKLPLDGEWPENRPRLGRDGQYQLPLNVQRTRKPASSQPQPPPPKRRGLQPRQLALPLDLPKRLNTRRDGGDRR